MDSLRIDGDPSQNDACFNEPNTDHDHENFNWCNQGGGVIGHVGGDLYSDNSGRLQYVRILEAGATSDGSGNRGEHYALYLGAVGYDTKSLTFRLKGL